MVKFISPEIIDKVISDFFIKYFKNSNFSKAFVAVSGGVDSATIIYLATRILKPENVIAAFLPSSITSNESNELYLKIIKELKIDNHYEISIDKFLQPYLENDNSLNNDDSFNKLRKGNILARIRMILSYDIAAKHNALVVGTENKTEYLLGYSTQWGDAAAAFHPMGDIYKTEVFRYANFLKVPEKVITRTPTAELWENQTDEKEIGLKYSIIDEILFLLFDKKLKKEEIIIQGYNPKDVERIIELVKKSEYKRRLPPSASFENLRN